MLKSGLKTVGILALSATCCAGAQSISLSLKAPKDLEKKGQSAKPGQNAAKLASAAPPASTKADLPDVFDGWVANGAATQLGDAQQADGGHAAALKEYGFTDGTQREYKRGAETLTLRMLRFGDLSGAYGAYSYYRKDGWPREDIGSGAASDKNHVLFWKGATVVDAVFSRVNAASASELRNLAADIPMPQGNRGLTPTILASLPQKSLVKQTTHYALGPLSYTEGGGVLPAELVAFDKGAEETVTANYDLSSNPATLTLINYPTPQLAAAQEAKISAYLKSGGKSQPGWTPALQNSDQASLEVHRSGPIVAVVSGDAIPRESHDLLQMVHYDEQMTSIPQPVQSEVSKTSQLLVGIATICIIGSGAAILLGLFLGGGRALYRVARGKPASSVHEAEFIRLNLRN